MIGTKLRSLRLERGLSVREAARRSGLSPATLSNWENLHVLPQLAPLRALAQGIEIPEHMLSLLESHLLSDTTSRRQGMPLAISLGPVLFGLRHARGLSTSDLSRQIGIPVSTLSRWEHGETIPDRVRLGQLLEFYDPADTFTSRLLAVSGGEEQESALALPGDPDGPIPELKALDPTLFELYVAGIERVLRRRARLDERWWNYYARFYREVMHAFMFFGKIDEGAHWSRIARQGFPLWVEHGELLRYALIFEQTGPDASRAQAGKSAMRLARMTSSETNDFLWEYGACASARKAFRAGLREEIRPLHRAFIDRVDVGASVRNAIFHAGLTYQVGNGSEAVSLIDRTLERQAQDREVRDNVLWIRLVRAQAILSLGSPALARDEIESYLKLTKTLGSSGAFWRRNLFDSVQEQGLLANLAEQFQPFEG